MQNIIYESDQIKIIDEFLMTEVNKLTKGIKKEKKKFICIVCIWTILAIPIFFLIDNLIFFWLITFFVWGVSFRYAWCISVARDQVEKIQAAYNICEIEKTTEKTTLRITNKGFILSEQYKSKKLEESEGAGYGGNDHNGNFPNLNVDIKRDGSDIVVINGEKEIFRQLSSKTMDRVAKCIFLRTMYGPEFGHSTGNGKTPFEEYVESFVYPERHNYFKDYIQ